MQIVQELCKRPGLNRTGFDMPTIYLPELCSKVRHNQYLINNFNEKSEPDGFSLAGIEMRKPDRRTLLGSGENNRAGGAKLFEQFGERCPEVERET
jgi:hypothetical protein